MATTNDLECFKGEDIEFPFYITPVEDISSWTIRFALKRRRGDSTSIVDIPCTITDGPSGFWKIPLAAANTLQTPGTYYYDVWRLQTGGDAVLTEGEFVIKPEVRK